MLKKHTTLFTAIILLSIFQFGCESCGEKKDDPVDIKEDIAITKSVVDEEAMNEIISSFSSPVEMAALMQSLEVPFSKHFIVDPKLTEDYDTKYKKAFALGVLSTDLGYLNVYEKTSLVLEYLSAIKKISDDLRIGQFFDFATLKRISQNGGNVDSLLFLTVTSFHDMDEHLRQNSRSNLSLLIITGVWIEGLYLITQVAVQNPTEKLKNRIGEQKTLFNFLYPILKLYKKEKYFKDLVDDFDDFRKIFEEVKITYTEGDVTVVEDANGNRTFIGGGSSNVEMTDEQLQDMIKITEKIRNKLINL